MTATTAISPTSSSQIQMDYLNLLITQLRNQDPSSPMDNGQMASQLAQLSQLQQIENMNSTFSKVLAAEQSSQAAGMIGRQISFLPDGASEAVTAIVSGTQYVDGQLFLKAGKYFVVPDAVLSIQGDSGSDLLSQMEQASGLIGRQVSFLDGQSSDPLTGSVSQVKLDNGVIKYKVGESLIEPSRILSIQ